MSKKTKKPKTEKPQEPTEIADFTDAEWAEHVARHLRWFPASKLTLDSDRSVANWMRKNQRQTEHADVFGGIEVPADIKAYLGCAEREARSAGGTILDVDVVVADRSAQRDAADSG